MKRKTQPNQSTSVNASSPAQMFPPAIQRRLDELLVKDKEGSITLQEENELTRLIAVEDQWMDVKAKQFRDRVKKRRK